MREANTYRQLWTGLLRPNPWLSVQADHTPIYGLADIVIANSCDTKTDLERMGSRKKSKEIFQ